MPDNIPTKNTFRRNYMREHVAQQSNSLAVATLDEYLKRYPDIAKRYTQHQRRQYRQDFQEHLLYLGEALVQQRSELFTTYIAWMKPLYTHRNIQAADIIKGIDCLRAVLHHRLPRELTRLTDAYLTEAIATLQHAPDDIPSDLETDTPSGKLASTYLQMVLEGRRQAAINLILRAVDEGMSIKDVYRKILIPLQYEIGRLWQLNRISVAEEHLCTAATQQVITLLYPRILDTQHVRNGFTIVATCVDDELHEVGIRIVADFFELDGWDTWYLGANMPDTDVVKMLIKHHADLLAISVTMTFHIERVESLIMLVRSTSELHQLKILVGGYPFTIVTNLWQLVGADAYATDADAAVECGRKLVGIPSCKHK